VLELNGIDCIPLDSKKNIKKSITSSKSFGIKTDSLEDIKKALAIDVARAGEKLREQNCVTGMVNVFLLSNPFKIPFYSNMVSIKLPFMVSDTPNLIKYSLIGLERIFKRGYIYKKCGVVLSNISPVNNIQLDLFNSSFINDFNKRNMIMKSMDRVNMKWGKGAIKIGSMGIENTLKMKQDMISNRYTTDWNGLLEVQL